MLSMSIVARASRRWSSVAVAVVVAAASFVVALAAPAGGVVTTSVAGPVGNAGSWLTDAQGRVVILHGLNQVSKVAPYEPSSDGFGDDDAAFLQANGFDAMRIGVIWAAVEPTPGHYDDAYLASIRQTVSTLAAHGIVSLLDFHQDLYNQAFQGEGAPAWAVQDGGLPNPPLGFPGNYFGNLAEDHAWDAFWSNAKASDGVGLQDHYAAAWAHVATYFRNDPSVLGYEVLNEPWPGTVWEPCLLPLLGCAGFDTTLTAFYQKVATAIRAHDPRHLVWIEPNVLFSYSATNHLGTVNDPHLGFAFHDYCPTEAELQVDLACGVLDSVAMSAAEQYPRQHGIPAMMTEFGATSDTGNLTEMVSLADSSMLNWTEWAYTGNDITSTSPNGQALVLDPSEPPTGANVVTSTLDSLAESYPQAVAGIPQDYGTTNGVFTLTYRTARAGGGTFPAGSQTVIAAPAVRYPNGYRVSVSGGHVVSAANSPTLRIASDAGASVVDVAVARR